MDRTTRAAPILALIRRHESEGAVSRQSVESAYDVVWSGIKPADRPKKLSALTVERVLWWQDVVDPLYMSEAAGAYQIMEDTLRGLQSPPGAIFDPPTQDALALQLMDRRGWADVEAGRKSVEDFANQLAREWASLPVVSPVTVGKRTVRRGQSYYAGDGLNRAHATPEEVLGAIREALALGDSPPVSTVEDAVVAWLQSAPSGTRTVIEWLNRAPGGVY